MSRNAVGSSRGITLAPRAIAPAPAVPRRSPPAGAPPPRCRDLGGGGPPPPAPPPPPVQGRRLTEEPVVGKPAEHHVLFHRHREIEGRVLPHDRQDSGHLPPPVRGGGPAQDGPRPGTGPLQARKDLQKRALPCAVRPQQDGHLPLPDPEVDSAQHIPFPVPEGDIPCGQEVVSHGFPPLRRRR